MQRIRPSVEQKAMLARIRSVLGPTALPVKRNDGMVIQARKTRSGKNEQRALRAPAHDDPAVHASGKQRQRVRAALVRGK